MSIFSNCIWPFCWCHSNWQVPLLQSGNSRLHTSPRIFCSFVWKRNVHLKRLRSDLPVEGSFLRCYGGTAISVGIQGTTEGQEELQDTFSTLGFRFFNFRAPYFLFWKLKPHLSYRAHVYVCIHIKVGYSLKLHKSSNMLRNFLNSNLWSSFPLFFHFCPFGIHL